MSNDHRFQLWQDGMMVAAVSAPTRHDALREISHYAAMYEKDGPVQIREVKRRKASAVTSHETTPIENTGE